MKKLMIAAAIVCAAAVSQAANVAWDNLDGAIYKSDGSGVEATGYTAYFFSTVDAPYATIVDALTSDLDGTLAKGYKYTMGTSVGGYFEQTDLVNVASFDSLDEGTAYLVVLDAATAADAKNFYVSPTDVQTIAKGIGMSTSFYFDTSSSASQGAWTAVPEPTSGLLLLLGVAGLALRRRRA